MKKTTIEFRGLQIGDEFSTGGYLYRRTPAFDKGGSTYNAQILSPGISGEKDRLFLNTALVSVEVQLTFGDLAVGDYFESTNLGSRYTVSARGFKVAPLVLEGGGIKRNALILNDNCLWYLSDDTKVTKLEEFPK